MNKKSTDTQALAQILAFTHEMYGLKTLLRFKDMPYWADAHWKRWDSIAEHSYRMALLAVLLEPYLNVKVDLGKTLKMTLVHDIVELITNDASPIKIHGKVGGHAFDNVAFQEKYTRETAAAEKIFSSLPDLLGKECVSLFKEYVSTKAHPKNASPEGKFAYALDKIEATIQIIDWRKIKNDWLREHFEKSMKYLFEWSSYDPTLKAFCELIEKEGQVIIKTGS